jgi:hypothetical protein
LYTLPVKPRKRGVLEVVMPNPREGDAESKPRDWD